MRETKPSKEYVKECLRLADEFLEDSKKLLALGRLRSALDRAYYATFHAAQAILASEGFKPKTHAGLRKLFGREVVKRGLVEKELGKFLTRVFSMRQVSTYDIYASIEEAEAKEIVNKAERFIGKIKEILP